MTTRFLDRPDGRLAYHVTGPDDAPLAVALHGMGANRHAFRLLAPALVEAGFRVASLDLRGHGESTAVWPAYDAERVAEDAIALVHELGGGPAVLVGSSVSSGAVTFAAARSPQDVAGIVLVGATTIQRPMNPVMRLAFWAVTHSVTLWGTFYRSLFKAGRPAGFADDTAGLLRQLREPGRLHAVAAVLEPTSVWWADGPAAEVTCPVLVVMGTRDPDFKDAAAEARAAVGAFTGTEAQLLLVQGAGHYPFLETPDEVGPAIAAFAVGAPAAGVDASPEAVPGDPRG
ncbi:alpha/beta hydrolase [Antribacter sp. KLBMP9083]|uniref:Alpha/beta hydrolase n=1 Tax=Antribacter soli TaxID=2910976 RepID=A0AA41U7J5_9MICO|nr:alpha/beta hydrolase [Antribacter soli]MCF4121440.1 alpha/beta hydrolase [Antribacter soli]